MDVKKVIKKMLDSSDFERIINNTLSWHEKRKAKQFYKLVKEIDEKYGIEDFPLIPLICSCDSADVWKDIVIFMITRGEEKCE